MSIKYKKIRNLSEKLKSKFYFDYDTSVITWFKAGGRANIFCIVNDENELEIILNHLDDIPFFVIGAGSNTLVRDGGFNGMIIKLGKGFNKITLEKNLIKAGASILDLNLSKFAFLNSISNFEFYSGIPGTIGGAIKMNAGCYGNETKNVVKRISIITKTGKKKFLENNKLDFSYRNSNITEEDIITSAEFKASIGDKNEILFLMDEIKNKRNYTQPLKTQTSGSTFKNPNGLFAAKLIEEANCKGLVNGDAMVSLKHSNFLINTNKSTAKEIEDLGKDIQDKVYKKFNIILEWEIKIIGDYV